MNNSASNFYSIHAGVDIPPLRFTMNLTSLVKYAGATWDFHRFHYDAAFAQSAGMPAPFVDGQMFGALMARSLMSWAGPNAFLRRLRYRQEATVFVDETVVITGTVTGTSVECGQRVAEVEMHIVKTDGAAVIRNALGKVQLATAEGSLPSNHEEPE